MPPISDNNPQDDSESYKVPTIGIIYPPPELRNIVDKTAGFVARNGPEFESRIRQNEINNAKFNFLNPGDPYHAYYQHKVKEIKEGKSQEEQPPPPAVTVPAPVTKTVVPVQQKKPEIAKIIEAKIVPKEPPKEYEFIVDPPSINATELEVVKLTAQFVARNGRNFQTSLMNREQRNVQFDFLRPQHSLFSYFRKLVEQYTKILIPDQALTKELEVRSTDAEKVLEDVRYRVEWIKLQDAEKRRREEDEERERIQYAQIDWHDFVIVETVDYMPNEVGNFPPPTTPKEVGTRALLQQRLENDEIDVEMEVESDEEGAPPKEKTPAAPPAPVQPPRAMEMAPPASLPPPPLPPAPEKVVVRNFNPPQKKTQAPAAASAQKFLISPITGEKIPADKMEEHMRIGLLDPRWVEQRDKQIHDRMAQDEVFAAGSSIESSLKQFAERRTDIFGQEETAIGMRIGEDDEEKMPEKVIWDGHSASAESVARQARANITIDQQIQQIHKMKGLVADEEKEKIGPAKPSGSGPPAPVPPKPTPPPQVKMPPPPQMASVAPPGTMPPSMQQLQPPGTGLPPQMLLPPQRPRPPMLPPNPLLMPPGGPPLMMIPQPPPSFVPVPAPVMPHSIVPPPMPPHEEEEAPASKKQKTEDQLIPEEDFCRSQPEVIPVRIAVPNMSDKTEWKLNGQLLSISLPIRETFGTVKSRIQEMLGMPPGKQKLVHDGIFVKDNNSLAFYNVLPNGIIQLQLKERGGRKK